jgi:hypothetical protein
MKRPSLTARHVAWQRASLERAAGRYGDPDAEKRLDASLHGWFRLPGAVGVPMASRTRFFDETTLSAIHGAVRQVVILGAGYDGRALRFAHPGVRFFESITRPRRRTSGAGCETSARMSPISRSSALICPQLTSALSYRELGSSQPGRHCSSVRDSFRTSVANKAGVFCVRFTRSRRPGHSSLATSTSDRRRATHAPGSFALPATRSCGRSVNRDAQSSGPVTPKYSSATRDGRPNHGSKPKTRSSTVASFSCALHHDDARSPNLIGSCLRPTSPRPRRGSGSRS